MKDLTDAPPIERVQHFLEHLKARATMMRRLIAGSKDSDFNNIQKHCLAHVEEIAGHLEDAIKCNQPRYFAEPHVQP